MSTTASGTSGGWLGWRDQPFLVWSTTPPGGVAHRAAVLLPPVGYEYWSAHRTMRTLAERLAAAGTTVLRVDYPGTGDAAGDQCEPGALARWRSVVGVAAAHLRAQGADELALVGVRLGGTIALLEGAGVGADAIVAWAPITAGRRYVRELKVLGQPGPSGSSVGPDGRSIAGFVFTEDTLRDLAALDLGELDERPSPRVLVLGTAARSDPTFADRLAALGVDVDRRDADGGAQFLDLPTEYATVPDDVVDGIVGWLANDPSDRDERDRAPSTARALDPVATFPWANGSVTEQVVHLGPQRLTGVLTVPADEVTPSSVVVFLNTGSEPHVGPGRAWVDLARSPARDGPAALRVDWSGWGESPDLGHAPARPYDQHAVDETSALVDALHEGGFERVVLAGLCGSAWIALRLARRRTLDGVIALNPQLYWQPGDPVEATMTETRRRREQERARDARLSRWKVWDALDLVGVRAPSGRWLDDLASGLTPIALLFAEGDDGIEHLRQRAARRLRAATRTGQVTVRELPGIDHPMHRHWFRPVVLDAMRDALRTFGVPVGRVSVATPGRGSTASS